jgi:PAS domain S-box-containing protein
MSRGRKRVSPEYERHGTEGHRSLAKIISSRVSTLGAIAYAALAVAIALAFALTIGSIERRMSGIAFTSVSVFDSFFFAIRGSLLASADEIGGYYGLKDGTALARGLLAVVVRNPAFTRVAFVDSAGRIVASRPEAGSDPFPEGEIASWSATPPAYGVVAFGASHFAGQSPLVDMAVRAHDGIGLSIGLLVVQVDLSWLWETTIGIRVGQSGYSYITDQSGHLIVYRDRRLLSGSGTAVPVPEGQRVALRQGLEGGPVLTLGKNLASVPWFAVIEEPLLEALSPAIAPVALIVAIAIALGLLLRETAAFALRDIARPLARLRAYIGEVESGNLKRSAEGYRDDEIGQLASSFDLMLGRLHDAFADLQERIVALDLARRETLLSEEKYRAVVEQYTEGLFLTDERGFVCEWNRACEVLTGLGRDSILGKAIWDLQFELTPPGLRATGGYEERKRAYVEALEKGRSRFFDRPIEAHVVLPDGRERETIQTIFTVTTSAGFRIAAIFVDVTDRNRSQRALERWAHVFEHAGWGIAIESADGQSLELTNPAFARMHGYEPGELEAGRLIDLFAPEARDDAKRDIGLVLEKGHHVWESVQIRKDLTRFPVLIDAMAVRDEAGTVAYRVVNVQDITERKMADEELRRMNRELRAIGRCERVLARADNEDRLLGEICAIVCEEAGYRMAWVGFAEADERRGVRPVAWAGNEDGYLATAEISWGEGERGGGPTGIAIRTGQPAYIQDFAADPRVAAWRESALARGYRSSIALPLKDQSRSFGALMIYSAEPDAFTREEIRLLEELAGNLSFGITALRNQASKERALEALKLSEARFSTVFKLSPDPMYLVEIDPPRAFVDVNEAFEALTGATRAQAIGRTSEALGIKLDEATRERYYTALGGEGRVRNIENRVSFADGHSAWLEFSAEPIESQGRRMNLTIARDITQRKLAEEGVRTTLSEKELLLRELESRTEEVRLLLSRVEGEREEERTRVARELHDELGQGVTSLGMALYLLERRIGTPTRAASEMISDMRTLLSELSDGMRRIIADLRPSVLDRVGLSQALARLAADNEERSGVRIEFSSSELGGFELPDETRTVIYRVAKEALTNALLHSESAIVRISLQAADGQVVLEVRDEGKGFEPSVIRPGERRSFGILGMRERCRSLGGEFTVTSEPGAGTVVRASFWMPGKVPRARSDS